MLNIRTPFQVCLQQLYGGDPACAFPLAFIGYDVDPLKAALDEVEKQTNIKGAAGEVKTKLRFCFFRFQRICTLSGGSPTRR